MSALDCPYSQRKPSSAHWHATDLLKVFQMVSSGAPSDGRPVKRLPSEQQLLK